MPRDLVLTRSTMAARVHPGLMVLCAGIVLVALTFADWSEMAHQWWDIDTYSHILLVPPIIAWLVWLRRDELAKVPLAGWWPGLLWMLFGLGTWLAGRQLGINTIAQGGAVLSLQGAVLAILGLRAGLLLAFPLGYAFVLVPFGGEFIPPLQMITAEIATALSQLSGIETVADGIHIDTPAGLFIVAEECSGVKFLIAMLALGVLVAHSCFTSWTRRCWFLLACILVPIVANGIRAWATIYIAQFVGAEAAGSFDHIVYGWVFFGVVIALVLGVAWRWFEREPEEAGWSADEVDAMPLVHRFEGWRARPALAFSAVLAAALVFAVLARLG
ncbi:exosortase A [Qipengyuania mesophila]|uniref:exosortase A n=2 Tax=Qipengyuania mesophila TaxID=2867246 RepID=UPI00355A26E7